MFGALLLTIFLLIFVYFLHRFVIKPYLSIQYYRKNGFTAHYFFPIVGLLRLSRESIEKHNDFSYFRKKLLETTPETRGLITNFLDSPLLFISDTSLKKDFFVNKHYLYEKHPTITSFVKGDESEASNLLFSEGEKWKRSRKVVSKIFHHEFMTSNIGIIANTTDKVFNQIQDLSQVNLMNEFQTITGNVILRSLLGDDFLERKYHGVPAPVALADITSKVAGARLGLLGVLLGKRVLALVNPSLKRDLERQKDFRVNFVGKYLRENYEEYRKKIEKNPGHQPENFLESNFLLVDKGEEGFTMEDVASNIYILFLAGTDTTGHWLAHTMIFLWKYPEIQQKLLKELENVNADIKDASDYDKIKNLPYLNAVLKEALRVSSPAPDLFLRRAVKDHMLGDLHIKKNTVIALGFTCNNHDPKIFRNPMEFIPERWIKGHELYDNAEEKDPYTYIPFSAGARNCIGQHMANIEARIILVKFLKRFQSKSLMKEPLTWILRFLLEPKEDVLAKLTEIK